MKTLGITDFAINYYTVSGEVLVSVMETKNDATPLVVLARGSFGRTVWTVAENVRHSPDPQQSDEILQSALSEPRALAVSALTPLGANPTQELVTEAEIKNADDALRAVHSSDFASWLDWNVFGCYLPFDYRAPFQRPRVIDLLAKLGLFEQHNTLDVRFQPKNSALTTVIQKLDLLENCQIVPIVLTHILPSDTELGYNESHIDRMTPLMGQFLSEIGEAMSISREASERRNLPEFKSLVPVFPCFDGFAAIMSPALCQGGAIDALQKIAGRIRIIFNETDFEINTKFEGADHYVLIVKPAVNGLYFVWQASHLPDEISPFAAKQLLSARTMAFYMTIVLESAIARRRTANLERQRRDLIAELCPGLASKEFGPLASEVFTA